MTTETTATTTTEQPPITGRPDGVRLSRREREQLAARGERTDRTQTPEKLTTELISETPPTETPPGETPPTETTPTETPPKPASIKDLAEQLQIKPADVYAAVVPMGDIEGEPVTVGQLKDWYKAHHADIPRLQTLDQLDSDYRTERHTMLRELDAIVAGLPREALSPQYRAQVKQSMERIAQQESAKLLEVYPEWREPIAYQSAVESMVTTARRYGLTETDVANIVDSRWIRALHDLAAYRKRESAAQSLTRESQAKRPAHTASPGARTAARPTTRKQDTRTQQAAAVARLLKPN